MRFSFKIVTSACRSDFSIFICDQAFFSFSGALKTADGPAKKKERRIVCSSSIIKGFPGSVEEDLFSGNYRCRKW